MAAKRSACQPSRERAGSFRCCGGTRAATARYHPLPPVPCACECAPPVAAGVHHELPHCTTSCSCGGASAAAVGIPRTAARKLLLACTNGRCSAHPAAAAVVHQLVLWRSISHTGTRLAAAGSIAPAGWLLPHQLLLSDDGASRLRALTKLINTALSSTTCVRFPKRGAWAGT